MTREFENKKVVRPVETKRTCNGCGLNYEMDSDFPGFLPHFIQPFQVTFDYASDLDGWRWRWDLCEDCIKKICDTFLIPPEKTEFELMEVIRD